MTLGEVAQLFAYWTAHPPLHLMVAAYLGVGRSRQPPRASDAASLFAELGPGFARGDVHRGLPPAVLDFAELRRRVT